MKKYELKADYQLTSSPEGEVIYVTDMRDKINEFIAVQQKIVDKKDWDSSPMAEAVIEELQKLLEELD